MTSRQLARRYYQSDNFKVKIYNTLRLTIFPIDWFSELLNGLEGTILCLGCGYGILETVLAASHPRLRFLASDLAKERVETAKTSVRHLPNITFTVVDVTKLKPSKPYDHILFIDLVHHLPDGEQVKLLDRLWDGLKPKGIMIMKDVDTKPTWKYLWNYIHDSLMAGPPLTYYPSDYYINYFRSKGGLVTYYKPTNFHSPYNHYALKILKP